MTQIGMEDSSTERTQRIYARLAGFLFLWLIITGLAGMLTISHIVGAGDFATKAKRVVASEHLYRLALSSELIETLSALLLAFALYATLRSVDKLLAQLAMYCRLGESFIGCVGVIFGFVKLHLYVSPQSMGALGTDQSQALMDLLRQHKVVLFVKGTPQAPQCGFSAATMELFKKLGAQFHTVDILANPDIRAKLPGYSNWPTFPQVFIGGKLIGGCDIVHEMHENGELEPLLK